MAQVLKVVYKTLNVVGVVWGGIAAIIVVLNWINLLPVYDIHLQKKTGLIPRTFLYPGQNVRLSAEFARGVSTPDIQSVFWKLSDSSGRAYTELPTGRDVDVRLPPDFAGTVRVDVRAKMLNEDDERHGAGSIQIVQNAPLPLSYVSEVFIDAPQKIDVSEFKGAEIYAGAAKWEKVGVTLESGKIRIQANGGKVPIWDGLAFLRFRSTPEFETVKYHVSEAVGSGHK